MELKLTDAPSSRMAAEHLDVVMAEVKKSVVPHARCYMFRGEEEILRLQGTLEGWCASIGQPGAMADLAFFVQRSSSRWKTPCLLLFKTAETSESGDRRSATILAAAFCREYRLGGVGSGIFVTDDTTGRRSVVAEDGQEALFAARGAAYLLERGAHLVAFPTQRGVLSGMERSSSAEESQETQGEATAMLGRAVRRISSRCRFGVGRREIQGYLPLQATLEETMATLGKRTRNHLRYYRRKAEKEVGCVFVPDAKPSTQAFLDLNARGGKFTVPDAVVRSRLALLEHLQHPVIAGLQDERGEWLSLTALRRFGKNVEMLWQMNSFDHPSLSLSTVLRAYLIESEVEQGTERFFFEGGTMSSLSHAFRRGWVTDVVAHRGSLRARLFLRYVKRLVDEGNALPEVLASAGVDWRSGTRG